MKALEEILTKEEANFVKLVYQCPGSKFNGGEAIHWIDDGTEYGQNLALWEKPEELGLIKCVGSYKWVPTDRLRLGVQNDFKFNEEDLAKAIAIEDCSNCDISAGVQCSSSYGLRKVPLPDFEGNDIYEGDVIKHPSGERGTVVFLPENEPEFQWKVDYGSNDMSSLGLQIGSRGQAVVIKKTYERPRIENIDNKYLNNLAGVGVDEYDRMFRDATSRAVEIYREWNQITGVLAPGTSYFYEVESCVIDAVHCGLQRALGIQVPLQSEERDV